MYFMKGVLPWQGLAGKNKNDKYDRIKEKKCQTTVEQLCKGVPEEFAKYINYCKCLKFDEKPDYNYLRGLFKTIMTKNKFEWDGLFDWILKKDGKHEQLHSLLNAPKEPALLPRTATINEFREERKESRTNLGA